MMHALNPLTRVHALHPCHVAPSDMPSSLSPGALAPAAGSPAERPHQIPADDLSRAVSRIPHLLIPHAETHAQQGGLRPSTGQSLQGGQARPMKVGGGLSKAAVKARRQPSLFEASHATSTSQLRAETPNRPFPACNPGSC